LDTTRIGFGGFIIPYSLLSLRMIFGNNFNGMLIKKLCLLVAFGFFLSKATGQSSIYKVFVRSEWQSHFDSLLLNYGSKKKFVEEFALPALMALSYYPELKNVPITFQFHDIKTTMEVRPEYLSVFKSQNRKYIIFIDNDTHGNEGILLGDVSFNAQIGVIGHELAHIMDFEHRSIKSIFGLGLDYITLRNHARYERSIDTYAIKRGLGWQILEFADFIENQSKATEEYKRFKKINYLSTTDIENEIAKLKLYSSFQSDKRFIKPFTERQ
jgi:hypothetical protein